MDKAFSQHIKNKEIKQFVRITLLLVLFIYILFRILDFLSFFKETIICDVEKTIIKADNEYFEANGYAFKDAFNRSTEKALSGTHSVKLSPENQYGMSISLEVPKPNEEYEASVWCYVQQNIKDSTGLTTLVASSGNKFWKGAFEFIEMKDGWGKLYLKFTMPNEKYTDPLVIYCWNNTKNVAYFDNMTIVRKNYWKYFKNN